MRKCMDMHFVPTLSPLDETPAKGSKLGRGDMRKICLAPRQGGQAFVGFEISKRSKFRFEK